MIRVSGVRNSWLTLEKKVVLARFQLGELFGAPLLDLVGHRAVDQRRCLLRDQAKEGFVGLIQRAPGAGGEDDDAGHLAGGLTHQRQHHGLVWRG